MGKNPGGVANIVSMPTIDNTYSSHTCKGPSSYDDPQLPALMLALAYLGVTEGPLWNAVRGNGLAYGVYMQRNHESGHLSFDVYRSPDAYKAFAAVRKVIGEYADGTTAFEDNALEGAVSSIVVHFADGEPNMSGAGTTSFIRQVVHGIPKDFNSQMLRKVKEVTVNDLKRVLKEMVMPCFEPEKSNVFVVSTPLKVDVSFPLTSGVRDVLTGFRISWSSLRRMDLTRSPRISRTLRTTMGSSTGSRTARRRRMTRGRKAGLTMTDRLVLRS